MTDEIGFGRKDSVSDSSKSISEYIFSPWAMTVLARCKVNEQWGGESSYFALRKEYLLLVLTRTTINHGTTS
jgi:hypothetical protein